MNYEKYKWFSNVSMGIQKADIVFKNINIVNVFTEEIEKADVAIADDTIIGIGDYSGVMEYDMTGKFICPGFIDSHLHLESTLVMPSELISQAVQWGTTTYIVDPHESANVSGSAGIDFILEQTQQVPANVFVMLPSCVPATIIDDNGYNFSTNEMMTYMDNPRILGLGEVMNYKAVVSGEKSMFDKLSIFGNRVVDGHAPFLGEKELTTYVLAGITTDHECCDYDYAMNEIRKGMYVLIREGSAAKNLESIVSGIVKSGVDTSRFCFCTDDKHIESIQKEGHISYNVKKSIELGIAPIKAIKMATINPATCYGLKKLGAIAPGYQADFIILNNLESIKIDQIYQKGIKVEVGKVLMNNKCSDSLKNTIHLESFEKNSLDLLLGNKEYPVIKMLEGQILTQCIYSYLPGKKYFEPNHQYKKIAVIERHKGSGKIGIGVVTGFGITNGAIASSVSHDSHNIIVIGDSDEDMTIAVNELIKTQGGYTLVEQGKIVGTLPLPIMGLMSDMGYGKVNRVLHHIIEKAYEMGVSKKMDPFITLSFMALPVIPDIRITTRGVYDVLEGKFIT